MIGHIYEYWWAYWGIGVTSALFIYRFRRSDSKKSIGKRFRSAGTISRYSDPDSPLHDPGLYGRQLLIVAIGIPLIGVALVLVWLLGG